MDEHVGRQLRARRNQLGLSQKAVGESVGVTFQQIQKYERGVNRISAEQLYALAKLLKVTVGYFYDGWEKIAMDGISVGFAEPQLSYDAGSVLDHETRELLSVFRRIGDANLRKHYLEIGRSMALDGPAPALAMKPLTDGMSST